jgi:hypothetical protein
MRRGLKIALLIAGVPFVALATAVIVFAIQEALAPDEFYASSLGLSLSECEQASTKLGATLADTREMCRRRVPKKPVAQFWSLGSSTMRVLANGTSRTITYEAPSAELIDMGVQEGAVFFAGEQKGMGYEGKAHRFSRECPPTPYPVVGELSNDGSTITLHGKMPQLDSKCKMVGSVDRSITLQSEDPKETVSSEPSMKPDQELFVSMAETARAVYRAASDFVRLLIGAMFKGGWEVFPH